MKRTFSVVCLLMAFVMSTFALTIEEGKVYGIANRNDNSLFIQDNGGDVVVMAAKSDNAYWQFIPSGTTNCYYIKNVVSGRYIQACPLTAEVNVVMGDTPVEYSVMEFGEEGADCFGFTSTDHDVTDFTAGCIGLNWKNDNTVQSFAAVAGTNHRSFWKITLEDYVIPEPEGNVDLTDLISNSDFEETNNMIEDGTNFRGIPYGWHAWGVRGEQTYTQEPGTVETDLLPKKSYGINGGSFGFHGNTCCWINATPMPDDFKLYQTVSLKAGNYQVRCLLSPMSAGDEQLTNLRLFAGDNACYFGSEEKYDKNLGPEANRSFMGLTVNMNGSDPILQTMILDFTLTEDATIELGIRTSNMLTDGSRTTSNNGRFRVDYFCLEKVNTPHVHNYGNNGICTCEGKEKYQEPELVGDFYEIKNAGNVEWFSNKVDEGGDANLQINGKLMNDIDMLSIENLHKPIGQTTGKKYNGTFDGQGFRIKNMIIERPNDSNIGFFGFLRGNAKNTTVKNLIIDKSCTIHGYNRVGGITGSCQNSGALITLENIVNEATIIAEHQDAAGIIGGQEGNGPKWLIRNVLNTGTITAKNEHPYAGALCCYLGGNAESIIENFVNLGVINGHEGGNIGRIAGTYTNIIDLSDTDPEGSTAGENIGFDTGLTKEDIANGKLAYTVGWGQFLGVDSYPTPLSGLAEVSYVGDAGYATFFDAANGYELNGDVQAYTGKIYGNYLALLEINAIPTATAVILKGTYFNKFAKDVEYLGIINDLKGATEDIQATGKYVLAQPEGKAVGFYLAETGVIKAGKAYLENNSNTVPLVKAFNFTEEDVTGIENVNANLNLNESAIYNIAGQRVNKAQKGIYIINGKKVLK